MQTCKKFRVLKNKMDLPGDFQACYFRLHNDNDDDDEKWLSQINLSNNNIFIWSYRWIVRE